jgi:ribosomal protein S26
MADRCQKCGGPIVTLNSRKQGRSRVRYYGCKRCGWRPPKNKLVIPIELTGLVATVGTQIPSLRENSG